MSDDDDDGLGSGIGLGLGDQATNPTPADGTENVSLRPALSWDGPSQNAVAYVLFFGQDSLPGAPTATLQDSQFEIDSFLEYDTEYVWRVDVTDGLTTIAGDEWRFRTIAQATPNLKADPASLAPQRAGGVFEFALESEDPGDFVTLTGADIPVNAEFSANSNLSEAPLSSSFKWSPGAEDLGLQISTFLSRDVGGERARTRVPMSVIDPFPGLIDMSLLDGDDGFRVVGSQQGDLLGFNVSGAGDVNADGYADFLITAPSSSPEGRVNAGSAFLIFGRPGLEADSVDVSDIDGSNGIIFEGVDSEDSLGFWATGLGDVDGDGYSDLMIGAPSSSLAKGTGRAYLIFGKPGLTGENGKFKLSDLDGQEGVVVAGLSPGDRCGFCASSAGDVNGDGLQDILVGAPNAEVDSQKAAGEAYLIYGSPSLRDSGLFLLSDLNIDSGRVFRGAGQDSVAGSSVSGAGDVNGDGYCDFLIGAPFADSATKTLTGAAYLLFGGEQIRGEEPMVLENLGELGVAFFGQELGNRLGLAVGGAGDIDRDGYAEFLLGAPFVTDGTPEKAGAAYLIRGASTLGSGGVFNLDDLDGLNGTKFVGTLLFECVGASVAGAGDVNGDGYMDLLLGSYNPLDEIGRSYIVFGPSDFEGQARVAVETLTDEKGVRLDGFGLADHAGTSVSSAGDIDGDGFGDLIVGAPFFNNNVGTGALVYGKASDYVATSFRLDREGTVPSAPLLVVGDGSDADSPSTRAWIGWDEGEASATTITLFRTRTGVSGLPEGLSRAQFADVHWQIESDRVANPFRVTVLYTESEVTGLDTSGLTVYTSDEPSGPWSVLDQVSHDASRRRIEFEVVGGSYFILGSTVGPKE